MADVVDVVVVGAGLAGLSAAWNLEQAGLTTLTVEASDEVGGHTRSRVVDGEVVELGAENFGPHHHHVRGLARQLGLTVRTSAFHGVAPVMWRTGGGARVSRVPGIRPSEAPAALRALRELKRMAGGVPPVAPWTAPRAAELDEQSWSSWLDRMHVHGHARGLLDSGFASFSTVPADRLSLLQVAWWVHRAGGILPTLRDGLSLQIAEGTQQLSIRLRERLRGQVVLGTPVNRVVQDGEKVAVHADPHQCWEARAAVVAVPVSKAGSLEFDPPLDPQQQALYGALRFGRATKLIAVSQEPVEVKHRVLIGGAPLPAAWLRGRRVATGFATGDSADLDVQVLFEDLADVFELKRPRLYTEAKRWAADPLSEGSYLAFAPGQLTAHGPHLKRPHGLVHFAGADRSSWHPDLEGAIENGYQVADALVRRLAKSAQPVI
ncbi:monoamine oxidase [Saccharopolyspora erythraea NRRL 2338]|uniref:Flavin-containing monoamine oxidase n=2 Tax=Saccharopolyspora erythraea TaxID=1836 RepID=A4FH61_SACEN|nr:NAD(P)/FAD-dependent oxidoreductase [Saccharopolyspora erythraea]EQD82705.1 amine oxidase [Saccharopolyspora erythraea D]PFG97086.1 monoamine oxidase [Saccharopolyspora erythraea NRRL 2338]QRK87296.1 FAD-dependent oxidoreductase [Saccharopolyspora erythraea]CAM03386.1 putative flavin-containing monoamine oxidase [Saccharopolyspora erythraea NRRL 2338]